MGHDTDKQSTPGDGAPAAATRHLPPITTVDAVLLTVDAGRLCVLLARRDKTPFLGSWALPGGFVHAQEDSDCQATAKRVLRAKTGFDAPWLEQLATFSGPDRDPRGWSISIAHVALVPHPELMAALPALARAPVADGGRISDAIALLPVDSAACAALPFDHAAIVAKAVERVRGKSGYTSLPAYLLPREFSLPELHAAYQNVLGTTLDRAGFRRKIMEHGFIEETGATRMSGGRPARLFRMKRTSLAEFRRMI